MSQASRLPVFQSWIAYLAAWLDYRREDMAAHMTTASTLKIQDDPEAIFQFGCLLCDVGDHEAGLEFLERAVDRGYFAAPT